MDAPRYPESDLDRPDRLLSLVGGFWASLYRDGGAVRAYLAARAAGQRAALDRLRHADACKAVATTPVLFRREWFHLTLRRGDRAGRGSKFDDGGVFGDAGFFDGEGRPEPRWPLPAGLVRAELVCDRINGGDAVLCDGVDYVVEGGHVRFASDPFDAAWASPVGSGDDAALGLWVNGAHFDERTVYRQHGYAYGLNLPSTPEARDAVAAVMAAAAEGSTRANVLRLAAAAAGAPLAAGGETVERVFRDSRRLWVVTDKNAYACGPGAEPVVAAGDALAPLDRVCDAFEFDDFRRGGLPGGLEALALEVRFLSPGYVGPLQFRDEEVAWTVEYDDAGRTRLSFPVYGFPGDAERFWDEVHERGVAAGRTLANLLDTRPESARDDAPGPLALPPTVNPLKFLCENVFRNNFGLLRLRPGSFGAGAVPEALAALGRVIHPGTALVVMVELRLEEEPIKLDAAEEVESVECPELAESVNLVWVSDRLDVLEVGGQCA